MYLDDFLIATEIIEHYFKKEVKKGFKCCKSFRIMININFFKLN